MGFYCNGNRVTVEGEYLGRAGCGCDLTAQIEAIPEDEQGHAYACPVCGNEGTVRRVSAVPTSGGKTIGE